ncbi:hypothetical protein HKX48_001960 [Thoreauomyces humboldtii]|nr:hypothetical protein HKX48_001960 [Thoreauomyces humboldtii]
MHDRADPYLHDSKPGGGTATDKVYPSYPGNQLSPVPRAPRRAGLAAVIGAVGALFTGPFAFILFCFYTTSRTRRAAFSAMTLVSLLQGAACFIAGTIIRSNCRKSSGDNPEGACASGYGFQHQSDQTYDNKCATSCDTIFRVLKWAGICFFALAAIELVGAILSTINMRRQRARSNQGF